MKRSTSIVALAVAFEGALGVVGCALAWRLGVPMLDRVRWTAEVAWRCTLGMMPMLALLALAMSASTGPIAELRREVAAIVRRAFAGASWWELGVVSIAAGVGEELLFRGALQPLADRWVGALPGLIAVSVLFGAAHALSATYFVLATLVGLYLGWLAQHYNDLVTPMVTHAIYDWAALLVLSRSRPGDG